MPQNRDHAPRSAFVSAAGPWIQLSFILLLAAAPASAQVVAPFKLNWSTVGGGGGASAGGAFALAGTAGQRAAGPSSGGAFALTGGFWRMDLSITDVFPTPGSGVLAFEIHPAQPNPLTRGTALAVDVPVAGRVRVQLFDVAGRLVRTLADGDVPAGRLVAHWDARGENGETLAGGVYFARVACPGHSGVAKLVLIGTGGVR